jgi:hypothetical protein
LGRLATNLIDPVVFDAMDNTTYLIIQISKTDTLFVEPL